MSNPPTLCLALAIFCLALAAAAASEDGTVLEKRGGGPSTELKAKCASLGRMSHVRTCGVGCHKAKWEFCLHNCHTVSRAAREGSCPAVNKIPLAKCTQLKNNGHCRAPEASPPGKAARALCAKTCGFCVAKNTELTCIRATGWLCADREIRHKKAGCLGRYRNSPRCRAWSTQLAACNAYKNNRG